MKKRSKQVSTKTKLGIGKKIIVCIMSVLFLASLGTSVAGNVILYSKLKGITQPGSEKPSIDGDNIIVTPIDPEPGIALLSIEPSVAVVAVEDESVNIPITVTPDVNTDVQINWTIRFSNPTSEWADKKRVTDYATITPDEDGALTATLNVREAFGEQIIITATVRNDAKVNVSATVDYACKYIIQGIEAISVESEYNDLACTISPKLIKSIGTIDEEFTQTISMTYGTIKNIVKDAIGGQLTKQNAKYYLEFSKYAENGSDSLTTKMFGIIPKDAFPYAQEYKADCYATFVSLSAPRYRLHTERLFFYHTTETKPQMLWPMDLSSFETEYALFRTDQMETYNSVFNNFIENNVKVPQGSIIDQNTGSSRPVYNYGIIKTKIPVTGGIVDGYILPEAFKITCTIKSEHNDITYEQGIPFIFYNIPPTVTSLEIDPPSIII